MGDRLLPHYETDGSVFVYKLRGVTIFAACGSGFSCARNARSGRICAAQTQEMRWQKHLQKSSRSQVDQGHHDGAGDVLPVTGNVRNGGTGSLVTVAGCMPACYLHVFHNLH